MNESDRMRCLDGLLFAMTLPHRASMKSSLDDFRHHARWNGAITVAHAAIAGSWFWRGAPYCAERIVQAESETERAGYIALMLAPMIVSGCLAVKGAYDTVMDWTGHL